jgi:hypothetical protein
MSAARVVRMVGDGDHVALASPLNVEDVDLVMGVTVNSAAIAEEDVQVLLIGELEDDSWSFIPFRRIFLGPDGHLVQVFDPSWKFVCVVGTALTPTRMLVSVTPAVILNP